MRIIELLIDDLDLNNELVGLDGIALVNRPATEETWLAFNDTKKVQPFEVLNDAEMDELAKLLNEFGENEEDLIKSGYTIQKIERVINPVQEFTGDITSDPNAVSGEDGAWGRIRYKYVGPQDQKNRPFCASMMAANRVFRIEDINRMSDLLVNEEISKYSGYYSIFEWRGSYNCRHYWVKVTYSPIREGESVAQQRILTNADRTRNVVSVQEIPQRDTITTATANNKRVKLSLVDVIDNYPLFDTIEEAQEIADFIGCSGVHIHKVNGRDYYMPCDKHQFESYNDYPKAASENACKVLRWIDEHGRDEVDGMTQTGLARANQLCNGENISEDTIARMAAFERHRQNAEISEEYKGTPWKDKGYVAWLGWGGSEGVEWASRKLNQIRSEQCQDCFDDLTDACWPGYEAIGTKIKDGREVPNCVPKEKMEIDVSQLPEYINQTGGTLNTQSVTPRLTFSLDDEKMEITGAAMVPDKLIVRSSLIGEPYYVYFSADTIKKLSYKYMREQRLDQTNIEHSSQMADDTYVVESWIVENPLDDKSNALGLSYPKGTWVITMKTENPQVWSDIKSGKYQGFSIQGTFQEKAVFSKDDITLHQIKNIINQIV